MRDPRRTRTKDDKDTGLLRCIKDGLYGAPVVEIENATRRVRESHYASAEATGRKPEIEKGVLWI